MPLRKNPASTSARDKLVRFVQYALTVILGAMAMSPKMSGSIGCSGTKRKPASSPWQRTFRSSLVRSYRWSIVPHCSRRRAILASANHLDHIGSASLLTVCVGCNNNLCHGNALKTAVRACFIRISNAASVLRQLLRVHATAASQGEVARRRRVEQMLFCYSPYWPGSVLERMTCSLDWPAWQQQAMTCLQFASESRVNISRCVGLLRAI